MPYQGNRKPYQSNRPATGGAAPARSSGNSGSSSGTEVDAIFSTGLFAPKSENAKAIGTVTVDKEIVIPAGSFINLYKVDDERRKTDKHPVYSLLVRPGTEK